MAFKDLNDPTCLLLAISSSCRNLRKRLPVLMLLLLGAWTLQLVPVDASSAFKVVSYVDYDCEDFGTRERAQSEFNKFTFDKYRLDGDGDGQVCEWNPSPAKLASFLSGLGLLLGRYVGKKKRFGADGVVPFPKGLFCYWVKDIEGKRTAKFSETSVVLPAILWWVPYLVMTILRDRVYPMDAEPLLLIGTCFALGCGLTYWVASTKDDWI